MVADQFTTERVAPRQQYDHWRDLVRSTHHAWDMPPRTERAFHGTIATRSFGPAELVGASCDPCKGKREAGELASSSAAYTGVLFVLEGREVVSTRSRTTCLEAGQFTVWDTTQPLAFEVLGRLRKLTLMVPTALVQPALGAPTLAALDAQRGCGALLLAHLSTLGELPEALGPTSERVALQSAIDLLGAAVVSAQGEPRTTSTRIVARAVAHVRRHLADPELTVESTAHALGLSRRQLDRAFAEHGRPLGRVLWAERLERCRRDLLLDRGAGVSEIAFRWGFSDAAHFSRAFRAAFAMSPTQYRASHVSP